MEVDADSPPPADPPGIPGIPGIIPMPGIAAWIGVWEGTMPSFLEQDNALPNLLVSGLIPAGILGFILCGLLASQLSSIDSVLSSA